MNRTSRTNTQIELIPSLINITPLLSPERWRAHAWAIARIRPKFNVFWDHFSTADLVLCGIFMEQLLQSNRSIDLRTTPNGKEEKPNQ